MHPNRHFLAHFVVHMPLCLHDLFRVAHPLHSNRGRGNRLLGYVPSGVRGYRRTQAITMQGGEGDKQADSGAHGGGAAQKHSEAGDGRPVDRGVWTAKTVKRPRQQPAHPQYANYWAPLTRKQHTMPHSAQPQHANYWAPRTRKRHQQEHWPQRPTESSDPTRHAEGRTGDRPGPRKGATTRRNVTQGGGGGN